jgi:hypothetical protein
VPRPKNQHHQQHHQQQQQQQQQRPLNLFDFPTLDQAAALGDDAKVAEADYCALALQQLKVGESC